MIRSKASFNPFNHPFYQKTVLNWLVNAGSVLLCLLILPVRLPGMELAGIGPNWLLIWVVAWSVKRNAFQGAMAGLVLGLLQDGMTSLQPTHVISLVLVGMMTARLQKQRYIQEDFISIALIVFGMAVLSETILALQFSLQTDRTLADIWPYQQRVAVASAILSSLWAPILYYPLSRWWEKVDLLEET